MKGGEVITESEGSAEARGFLGSGLKVKVCCSTCGCQSHGKAGRVTANTARATVTKTNTEATVCTLYTDRWGLSTCSSASFVVLCSIIILTT